MNVLLYTSLYPTVSNPVHGIFVGELASALAGLSQVLVLAAQNGFGAGPVWSEEAGPPGPRVFRCRFWTLPKIFKSLDCRLMARFSRAAFDRALRHGPSLVHAHYAYPDGAAAAILAERAGLPLVVTCHGSDIHILARQRVQGRLIAMTLRRAAAVVAVSRDLASKIERLGVDPRRIRHIPNGVDISRFSLADRVQARLALGLEPRGPLLLGAGRLEPVKDFGRLLHALALLEGVRLVLAGDGSQRSALERLAGRLGLGERVLFAGSVPHERLAAYYQAADALVISSRSEGWPTVIHEALACGTPVVAPALGGIPEALASPGVGLLVDSTEPACLARGIRQALATSWEPERLRQTAAAHDWKSLARRHLDLYEHVLGIKPGSPREVLRHDPPSSVAHGTGAVAPS